MTVDIVVNVANSRLRQCPSCNGNIREAERMLIGLHLKVIKDVGKKQDKITISSNQYNERFAQLLLRDLQYDGWEIVNQDTEEIDDSKNKNIKIVVYTLKRIAVMRALRQALNDEVL